MITKKLLSIVIFLLFNQLFYTQTSVIFSEGFNNSVTLFSTVSGSKSWVYNSANKSEGTHSYGTSTGSGSTGTYTIESNTINLSAYANSSLSFKVYGQKIDSNDNLRVSISENGGTSFTDVVTINGASNDVGWAFTATGSATVSYPASLVQSSSSGSSGISTINVFNLPSVTNLKIRITLAKNAIDEVWLIDDFKLSYPTPSNVSIVSSPSPAASGSCDQDYVSMTANGGEINNAVAYSENFDLGNNSKFADEAFASVASNTNSAGGSAFEGRKSVATFFSSASFSVFPYNSSVLSFNTIDYVGDLTFQFRYAYSFSGFFSSPGTIFLEGSTNGSTYTTLWSTSTPIGATSINVTMPAATFSGQSNVYFRFRGVFAADFISNATFSFDDIRIIGVKKAPVEWSPAINLYTDAALTIPYTSGANIRSVFAKPDAGETIYTLSTKGTPNKTASYTAFPNSKVFIGTVNSDWANASNWSPAGIPDISKCVKIPNGKTVNINTIGTIKTNANAEYVRVFSGGAFNILSNNSLTIQNALKNENPSTNPNVTLESDANLVQNSSATNIGSITVKRKAKMKRLDYTFWSGPVTGQNVRNFLPGTLATRFYVYNESNDYFDGVFSYSNYPGFSAASAFPLQNPNTYNFETSKGYAIRASNFAPNTLEERTYSFVGVPNNGTKTINITKNGNGFNLIGNPYPSNLSFKSFRAANSTVIQDKAYFWTNTNVNPPAQQGASYSGNNYATLTSTGGTPAFNSSIKPTDSIAVGQGFIVEKINSGTSAVTFNNTMRTNTNGVFFNSRIAPPKPNPKYWLKLTTPAKNFNTLLVGYVPGATNGVDASFDAEPIAMSSDMFYSIQDDKNLVIQGRTVNFSTKDKVTLGAILYESGNYEIAISELEGIFQNAQPIYLKDKLLNKMVKLNDGGYSFYAEAGVVNNRFEIVYKPDSTLSTEDLSKNGLQVYQVEGWMVIDSQEGLSRVWITDSAGKSLYESEAKGKTTRVNASHYPSGMYYITVETSSGQKQTKKILKK